MIRNTALFLTIILCCPYLADAQVSVVHPKVENLVNPRGMDDSTPRFGWQLEAARRNVLQTAYEIRVAATADALVAGKKGIWSSGKVSSDACTWIPYGGPALESGNTYWWQVRVWDNQGHVSNWSVPAFWQMGMLDASHWKADWISVADTEDKSRPSPLFRKVFSTKKKIRSATAFITAHGVYEAWLNGRRIGNDYLTPGWTAYQKRLQYQVYDVTELVKPGENAVGAMLGSGWWRGNIGFSNQINVYGADISLLMEIHIAYADGSREVVGTDGSWKYTTDGPVRSSELYHGETQDARKMIPGWSLPSFDDQPWKAVQLKAFPKELLVATYNEPIRKHETFRPVRLFKTPKGELVADFGQNLVGWVEMTASGAPGTQITLQFAEVLDKAGNFYTENLRAARNTDTWILRGEGEERFEPHFTFHGFRYAKIEGYPGTLQPEQLRAVALYSDMQPSGAFSSSDTLINQLQHNIQWGQRGNFLDVPTDCPQRDERLGWTGDAQAFSRTAMFNFDVHNFFCKWLKDLAADQLENGSVPFVIPNVLGANSSGSTGWADVVTIMPWNLWLAYGDRRALETQYPAMKAWVEFMRAKSTDDLFNTGFHFGDWLFYRPFDDNDGRSAVTDKYLIAQCFFAHSTQLLIQSAQVLGKTEDVSTYSALLQRIKKAFLQEYVTPNGRLLSPTQTAYTLALQFDMLPESQRTQAAAFLSKNIADYGVHLTTGFLGTPYLCHVLSRFGYHSQAYELLNQKSYPSWLYPVTMGATTIWERWDGIKPDGSFQAASMNSFNHYAYGAIGDWMYRQMAGLDTELDTPGYKTLHIEPRPGGGFTQASARLQTLFGPAASGWTIKDHTFILEVEIPANTTANLLLPTKDTQNVSENGLPLSQVKGVLVKGTQQEKLLLVLGSGKYKFEVMGYEGL